SSFKFATVVAQKSSKGTTTFQCQYYLHDEEWLFTRPNAFTYTHEFVQQTGGEYLSFLEPTLEADLDVIATTAQTGENFHRTMTARNINFGREMNTTDDAWRFV